MQQHFFSNPLEDRLRFKLALAVPDYLNSREYDGWASLLLQQETWSEPNELEVLLSIDAQARLFINSVLQTTRLLFELCRLPIFEKIAIQSVQPKPSSENSYVVNIAISPIGFVPVTIYGTIFQAANELCRWMAQHPPCFTQGWETIFHDIDQRVIKKIQKVAAGGKSTIPVLKVAHALGVPVVHLGAGVYQLGWGSKARCLDRSTTELDSSIGSKLAQHKLVTANLLRLAGLPAPSHIAVVNEAEAISAANQLSFPLVVKPADRERGEGVTVDVVDVEMVKVAFAHAHALSNSKQVIVERQVTGVCHRLFIANGRLLYAVKRLPMSVQGDGHRTIAQLVHDEVAAQEQKAPWNRSEIQPIDARALAEFANAGLSTESIPAKGVLVPLRRIESTADGGVDEEVTGLIHPENLSAALSAAQLFRLHIAGIDIISSDISKPWYENNAIINEVNFAPLFGGGEISRSYISKFLSEFIDGDGKIPIEIFDTEDAALMRQAYYQKQGLRCYFTSALRTLDSAGNLLAMPFNDIKQRWKALICRSDVDAIMIYTTSDSNTSLSKSSNTPTLKAS